MTSVYVRELSFKRVLEALPTWSGAKAAVDAMREAMMESFIVK